MDRAAGTAGTVKDGGISRLSGFFDKLAVPVKKYGKKSLAWLLCAASVSEALYIYTGAVLSVYTVISAAASAGLIALFGRLRKIKFGGLLYVGLLLTAAAVLPFLVGSGWDNVAAFMRWFFSGAQAEDNRVRFIAALALFMTFFITSAVYYFTEIIYRSAMLALVSLIPFALAVKAAAALPWGYAALAAAINLIFCLTDGRETLKKGSVSGGGAAIVYLDFGAAAILLALLLPKPSETPYYEKFEEAVSMFSFGGSGETVYQGEYKKTSGGADELLRGESKLLYVVSSDSPAYMKTQVFDLYDNAEHLWRDGGDNVSGSKRWQETAPLLSYDRLRTALGSVLDSGTASLWDDELEYAEKWRQTDFTESIGYSIVYAQEFPAVYLPAPARTVGLTLNNVDADWTARSTEGELFSNFALLPGDLNYTIRYYGENCAETLMASGLCDISMEEWGVFLSHVYLYAADGSEEAEVIWAFWDECFSAEDYQNTYPADVSTEIQDLADELTAGLEYDYQKAEALERYFLESGFLYDLAYEPPEDSDTPEYFLFESKTGICSDFATAYTLLARAAGLTVRYCEGFVPQKGRDSEYYYVYTENAHAYPEVYLPGAGWTRFEPTPANMMGGAAGEADDTDDTDYTAVYLIAAAVIVGFAVFVFLVMLMPKISESFFRLKVRRSGGGKAILMLYNRHLKNAGSRYGVKLSAFTAEQTAAFTQERTGLSLEPLTVPFTAVCYGGGTADRESFEAAYQCYKAQSKAMKRRQDKGRQDKGGGVN